MNGTHDSRSEHSFEAADLTMKSWYFPVKTVGEITFLGKIAIGYLICNWRFKKDQLVKEIKNLDKLIEIIKNEGTSGFQKIAENFENPKFPLIEVRYDSCTSGIEPMDEASFNRKFGSTTLNVCGWCRYANGPTRHCYHIESQCGILGLAGIQDGRKPIPKIVLKEYDQLVTSSKDNSLQENERIRYLKAMYPGIGGVLTREKTARRFNTPCFVTVADSEILQSILTGMTENKEKAIREKKLIESKIRFLIGLRNQAEIKPVLPRLRRGRWFNVDDPVMCFISRYKTRSLDDNWVSGKANKGYRYKDGGISVVFDKDDQRAETDDSYCIYDPIVAHQWEFDYLIEHPDFAKFWVNRGSYESFDECLKKDILDSLKEEARRQKNQDDYEMT